MSHYTGVSMCGSIIDAKRPGLIPCDCMKCSQRRKYRGSNAYYCEYYQGPINKNKKRCARYNGPKIASPKSRTSDKQSKSSRSCKKCRHYGLSTRYCKSFSMKIIDTGSGRLCKNFDEIKSSSSKRGKYSNSNKNYNKYKTKK